MTSLSVNRIKKELKEFNKFIDKEIMVEIIDSNLFHLKGTITGPADTPYYNGKFDLDIKIPNNYPFDAPSIKFLTKIWHPNISSVTGVICLDILKDKWSASMTIKSCLMSILLLLQNPIPEDPQDGQVAKQMLINLNEFNRTASYWKYYFASKCTIEQRRMIFNDYEKKLSDLKKINNEKSEQQLLAILSSNNWDFNKSCNHL